MPGAGVAVKGPPGSRPLIGRWRSGAPLAGRTPWRERAFPYVLNLPAVLVLLGLTAYPIALSFWISLHQYDLRHPDVFGFVWLANYVQAFASSEFRSALLVSLEFGVASVTLSILLSLGFALLLNEAVPGRGFMRALAVLPWAVPPIISATLWKLVYDPNVGALSGALVSLHVIGSYVDWLVDPKLVLPAVVIAQVWTLMPLGTIILLAALQAIPPDLYEAARVDRASVWRRFRRITLPWLLRPLLIVMIIETMHSLQAFDIFYVLTSGGPGDLTTVLSWLTYQTAFVTLDFGRGDAYAYVIMLVSLVLALFYIRSLYRRGDVV